ncbi:ferric reductase transmembrane protein-like protein [Leishmania donovani]|uniref:Ferric reductase transmembrane protein-like protein n=1 Tax=Leishmania donovani TaxID=5661 RepID=E9BLU8_LEIDO|nr:ferric reductase transmembrane protein-like protein [Leishmania donovani]CBZ36226.1 ferric reductase transmembrane protein-like protein [Leishmania donovani]
MTTAIKDEANLPGIDDIPPTPRVGLKS